MQSSQDLSHDNADMAKLRKSPKQQRQESLRKQNTITKLTPAEIRSLNNSVALRKRNGSSSSGSHNADRHTPPRTPESALQMQLSMSGRRSASLPTPPQSPDNSTLRRDSSASRNVMHIHSPIPQSHNKAGFVLGNGNISRPQSAASQRGMPTYRGPEMTRTGSYSMLHTSKLTHQIVENPLSQFSRPRQSRASVSPASQQQRQHVPSEGSVVRSQRSYSLPTSTILLEDAASPPMVVNLPISPVSPISPILGEAYRVPAVSIANAVDGKRRIDQSEPNEPIRTDIKKSKTVAVDNPGSLEAPSKFNWRWRKGSSSNQDASEKAEPRRLRRRTLSGDKVTPENVRVVAYENTKAGTAPEERDSLKGNLPSSRTSVYVDNKDDFIRAIGGFATHPAVRPLGNGLENQSGTPKSKGKEREQEERAVVLHDVFADDTVPMYSRCSCCGKLKKPAGNRSLSPVLENENLRTNISMEMERTDREKMRRERSGSLERRPKSTPIIPMISLQGNTVQARIAPKNIEEKQFPAEPMPMVNSRGDIIARGSEPIVLVPLRVEENNRKVVRFSSLYLSGQIPRPTYTNIMTSVKEDDNTSNVVAPKMVNSEVEYSIPVETVADAQHEQGNVGTSNLIPVRTTNDTDLIPPTLEEATGELMAALSGVDLSFNDTIHESGEPLEKAAPGLRIENALETGAATKSGEEQFVPGMALTTDDVVFQTPPVSVSIMSKPAPRIVSLKSKKASQKESIMNRSRYETKYTYHNGQIIAYTDYKKDSVTKPKSQPQPPIRESNNEKCETSNDIIGTVDNCVLNGAGLDPIQRNTDIYHMNQLTNHDVGTYRGIQSAKYAPIPSPQFGKHFGESSGTFRSYILPPGKFQSNLVESVLAATNGDHDGDHDQYAPILAR